MAQTEYDVTRLPKWAQHIIRKLRADVEDAERRLAATGDPSGPVLVNPYGNAPVFHGVGTVVRFVLSDETLGYIDVAISDMAKRRGISIRGGEQIKILPQASNTTRIELHDAWHKVKSK